MSVKVIRVFQDGVRYQASVDGAARFEVGRVVTYKTRVGLSNIRSPGLLYDPVAQRATDGHWADFIAPMAVCESKGAFNCLNSYDRAFFTFGFLQYAAHVPNGDFVKFLKLLLARPEAKDYFPDLALANGRIVKLGGSGTVVLETDTSTELLMRYFNPGTEHVENVEVINAAKLIHWSETVAAHRSIQIRCGIEHLQKALARYAARYGLDGSLDKLCLAVADIHHQGRGSATQIFDALQRAGSNEETRYRNVVEIGVETQPQRVKTLKLEIAKGVTAGVLARKRYRAASGDFA